MTSSARPRSPQMDGVANPRKRRRSRFSAAPPETQASSQTAVPQSSSLGHHVSSAESRAEDSRFLAGRTSNNVGVSSRVDDRLDLSAIPVAPVSTLKINQQAARAKKIKDSLKVLEADLLETNPAKNAFFDPSIRIDARTRRPTRTGFNFVAQGSITSKAEEARHRAERQAADVLFREAMAARAAQAGALPPLPPLTASVTDSSRGDVGVPIVEWWDAPFIAKDQIADFGGTGMRIREDRITRYIQHPVRIPSFKPERPLPVLPLMLTDKERKRLRRQRKLEKETERREMIAVGLMAPPPPKVKLSNLMRVLASEATADPTKVEADVRAQVAERLRKHEADNEARKKTKAELHEKAAKRAADDREAGLHTNVFRVTSMESAQHRFKVDMNARQLELTGALLMHATCNLVVVEGGKKALRKYRRLMLRRIDWNAQSKNGDDRGASSTKDDRANHCVLVWEGPLAEPLFEGFKTINMPTENSIRVFLKRRGMDAHFEAAMAIRMDDPTQGIRDAD